MRIAEKNTKVSCLECIHRRRILTCYTNGKECTVCKNACCCRKCSPDASGGELDYEKRRYFSAGIPIAEYIQIKKSKEQISFKKTLEKIGVEEEIINENQKNVTINQDNQLHITEIKNQENNKESKQEKLQESTQKKNQEKFQENKEEGKSENPQETFTDITESLQTEKNGQLSFLWN